MRGTPITGSAQGVSITETVARGQRILEDRPEPKGRERYAGRTNRPPRREARDRTEDRDEERAESAAADTGTDETVREIDGADETQAETSAPDGASEED